MIGVDLVYLPEFKKQLSLGGPVFLKKSFSKNELKNSKPEHLAGIWTAKEAVIKAIGSSKILMASIDITFNKNGQPMATYNKEPFEISIAHHGDYVVAIALGAKK